MNLSREELQRQNKDSISQAEQEELFRKQKKEYLQIKQMRKREQLERKVRDFGFSSSDEEEIISESSRQSANRNQNVKVQILPKDIKEIPISSEYQNLEQAPIYLPNKKDWMEETLFFNEKGGISLPKYTYDIKGIRKIKFYKNVAIKKCHKIKITYIDSNELILGASVQEKRIGLPLHYYIVAKIIQNRLAAFGIKLKENETEKMPGIPESIISQSFRYGKLLKKSQHLGNWQQRFIVINKEGVFSYKKFNQKPSIFISTSSMKELWTRFEESDEMLVIKIKHGSSKTEFGIPFADFLSTNSWLYHFYTALLLK